MTGLIAAQMSGSQVPPAATVQLHDQQVGYGHRFDATASYTISADGKVRDQAAAILETWLLSGTNSQNEVMATVSAGATPDETLGSWLACSSDRTWSVSSSGDNAVTTVLLVQIRDASSHTVLASASIMISASSWA